MRRLGALALLLVWAGALAAPQAYRVSGEVVYQARAPIGSFQGRNTAVSGEVVWDPEAGSLEGKVCLDLAAWDSGEPLRDKHTRSMFEVDKYPEACLVLTGIEGGPGAGETRLLGELTIHGVTRPVVIPGRAELREGKVVFEGAFETKITDWKMKRPSLMGFKVRDLVRVEVRGEAVPK